MFDFTKPSPYRWFKMSYLCLSCSVEHCITQLHTVQQLVEHLEVFIDKALHCCVIMRGSG